MGVGVAGFAGEVAAQAKGQLDVLSRSSAATTAPKPQSLVQQLLSHALDPAAAPPSRGPRLRAGALAYQLDHAKFSAPAKAKVKHYKVTLGCKITEISGAKRVFLARAVSFASSVLSSDVFAETVSRKKDWRKAYVPSDRILHQLRMPHDVFTTYVTSYSRDEKHPCRTRMADGETNAFVSDVVAGRVSKSRVLFLSEEYVARMWQSPDPKSAIRKLAKTLVHEALHVRGYSHAGFKAFRTEYNNTVPVYVGCMVMNWAKTAVGRTWMRRNCHLGSKARKKRSPYKFKCLRAEKFGRHTGRVVSVAMGVDPKTGSQTWSNAKVVHVINRDLINVKWASNGHVEAVDVCRIPRHAIAGAPPRAKPAPAASTSSRHAPAQPKK